MQNVQSRSAQAASTSEGEAEEALSTDQAGGELPTPPQAYPTPAGLDKATEQIGRDQLTGKLSISVLETAF